METRKKGQGQGQEKKQEQLELERKQEQEKKEQMRLKEEEEEREQLDLFDNALTPQAEQALDTSESAYSTGAVGVLDLLDSERVLLDVRLGRARLEADYLQALAAMERALGTNVPENER